MTSSDLVTVRLFGILREQALKHDGHTTLTLEVEVSGTAALQIALSLGLDTDLIEGVFVNHTVYGLDHPVLPGDRVAFVPVGTPGPHRFTLGLYSAGRSRDSSAD